MARILVVDDDRLIRDLVETCLEGHHIVATENGSVAVNRMAHCHKGSQFELVISDVDMPVMDGFRLLEWMHAEGLHVPVIIMTGRIDENIPRLLQLKVPRPLILAKPFKVVALQTLVGHVLDGVPPDPPDELDHVLHRLLDDQRDLRHPTSRPQ